jgi:hypothetical protein
MESEPFGEAKGYKQAAAASQVYNQGKLLHLDWKHAATCPWGLETTPMGFHTEFGQVEPASEFQILLGTKLLF